MLAMVVWDSLYFINIFEDWLPASLKGTVSLLTRDNGARVQNESDFIPNAIKYILTFRRSQSIY